MLRRLEHAYTRFLEASIVGLVAAVVLIVSAQIYVRTVHNMSFSWSEELARLCLAWLTFLGAAVVMERGAHIRVDVVSNALPPKVRAWLDVVLHVFMLLFVGVLVLTGPNVIWKAHSVELSALRVPASTMYAAPWVGALALVPYLLIHTARHVATARSIGTD